MEVWIDCPQTIPCDPCETVCNRGCIEVGPDISNVPRLTGLKCGGCGLCVAICPGLAIRLADGDASDETGIVVIPYEFLPLPKKDDVVAVVDREGREIGTATVSRVRQPIKGDPTRLIHLSADKRILRSIRGIRGTS